MSRSPASAVGSRDRVLGVLRESARPARLAQLTAATGLSANAVRFHLRHLLDDGAVRAAPDPGHTGPGRPANLYVAVPMHTADPASAYRLLAALLAGALSRSTAPGAVTDAGRDWAKAVAPSLVADPGADAVGTVRALLESGGFAPRVSADGDVIELHRCPFFELAVQQPGVVCGVHLGMVKGVLEQIGAPHAVRLVPVLDGSGPCLVRFGDEDPAPVQNPSTASPQEQSP